MWRVLHGKRSDQDIDDNAIGYERIARALVRGAQLREERSRAGVIATVRYWLTQVDERLESLPDEILLSAIDAYASEGDHRLSGAIADLLLEAQALGVRRSDERKRIQDRVGKVLKRRAEEFDSTSR